MCPSSAALVTAAWNFLALRLQCVLGSNAAAETTSSAVNQKGRKAKLLTLGFAWSGEAFSKQGKEVKGRKYSFTDLGVKEMTKKEAKS